VPASPGAKDPSAFRTIGEVSAELGIAQHILRYWESRFPQLKPLQRAGNRRYYRPEDVELVRRIHGDVGMAEPPLHQVERYARPHRVDPEPEPQAEGLVDALKRVRAELTAALAD